MSMFDKAIGYEFSQTQVNKQIKNANKALYKANREYNDMVSYYKNALSENELEIRRLKHRVNEFLEVQERNKKKFYDLKQSYLDYKTSSTKLFESEQAKVINELEREKKKTVLLEEKIKVLEATIKYLENE